jgi:hypothetical protein
MTRVQTRCAVALFLVLLVTWPLASRARPGLEGLKGAERLSVEAKGGGGGVFSEWWTFLSSLWGKEGSSVDPSGKGGRTPSSALPSGGMEDGGSSVDPSGHA